MIFNYFAGGHKRGKEFYMLVASYQPDLEDVFSNSFQNQYKIIGVNVGFNPSFGFPVFSLKQVFCSSLLASAHHPKYFYIFDVPDSDVFMLDIVQWNKFLDFHHDDWSVSNFSDSFIEQYSVEVGSFINSGIDLKYCECVFDMKKAKLVWQLPILPLLTFSSKKVLSDNIDKNKALIMCSLSDTVSQSFKYSIIENPVLTSLSKEKYNCEIELNAKEVFERRLLVPYLYLLGICEGKEDVFNEDNFLVVNPLIEKHHSTLLRFHEELLTDGYIQYKTYEHFDEVLEFFGSFVIPFSLLDKFNHVGRNDKCPCGSGLKYKKCHGKYF